MIVRVFCLCAYLGFVCVSLGAEAEDGENTTDGGNFTTTTEKLSESEKPPEPPTTPAPRVSTTEPPRIIYRGKILVCPSNDIRKPWFPLPCKLHKECNVFDPSYLCCGSKCLKGVPPPLPEPVHKRFFGIIDQQCPVEPLPEIFSIKPCRTDADCAPRICCKENGSVTHYCRTPIPKLDRIPYADDILRPVKLLFSYMQCTPAPPLVLDLFSKPCQSPLDCFPNLCCQENGKKFCRPPKRSILTLVAGITQKIGTNEIAKRLIERIT